MILHSLLISVIVTIAKFLGMAGFSEGQIIFMQSSVAFCLLLPFALYFEGKKVFQTRCLSLHFMRGIIGVSSLFIYIFALKSIPLTDSRAIALSGPVITFIFAIIFLREKLDGKKSIALFVSLIGGYIIINPGSVSFHSASLLVLLATILWSVLDLIIKQISKTESSIKQTLYLTGLSATFSSPFAFYNWIIPDNLLTLALMLIIGVIFLFNSFAIFKAIKNADLTTIMPFDFCGMIFTAIISYFVFNEIIKFNTLIGSIIVFLSSLYLIYHESKSARKLNEIGESNIIKE